MVQLFDVLFGMDAKTILNILDSAKMLDEFPQIQEPLVRVILVGTYLTENHHENTPIPMDQLSWRRIKRKAFRSAGPTRQHLIYEFDQYIRNPS